MSGKGNSGINNRKDSPSAKQNYTALSYGNNQGTISFGQIHKQGDVTAGVMLETPDGEHQLSLDIDGERTGWTLSTSPGAFAVESGSALEEAQDAVIINAKNGNICITATNGKIRMEANDIELIAKGDQGTKGKIVLEGSDDIILNAPKIQLNGATLVRIASPQKVEVAANAVLQMYGSIIRGVTDAVSEKDSKVGGKRIQKLENQTEG
tara:strand:+ start:604 stop:1230 length:627 start_codon:yes stop_codon:yes gene_type:complete